MKRNETGGTGTVVDLQGARRERRLDLYRARLADRMLANRVALETLYQGGTLFSPEGTRQGRALLKSRQLLQRWAAWQGPDTGTSRIDAPSW